jgi:Flp pilus assembly protein TadG
MRWLITKMRGLFPAFSRDKRGVTAIEFGIIAPVFFYFMFAIIELSFYGYLRSSVEQQVHTIARESKTGGAVGKLSTETRDAYFDRMLAQKLKEGTFSSVKTTVKKTTYQSIKNYKDGKVVVAANGFGSSNTIMQIDVVGNYEFFTPLLGMLNNKVSAFSFKTTVFFKNEYF